MAKRTSQSQANDTPAPTGPDEQTRRRTRGGTRSSSTGDATQAARATPDQSAPPPDTIAADPDVSRLEPSRQAHTTDIADSPTEEEIRARAYDLYLQRGGGHGAHEDDWYRAERELKSKKQ